MKTELEIWKSRAQAHEENYLQMLKRIDYVVAERDELRKECDELRNKLLEIEEILYNYRFDRNHSPSIR